jgi:hypothetical protein
MLDEVAEAKRLFNETWELMDLKERTAELDALMLHKAHASAYLWSLAGSPVNNARGEWQVSRVYSTLKMAAPALLHGRRSLEICVSHGIGDFDLAFGYEAVARAHAMMGEKDQAGEYKRLALAACENITEDEDRRYAVGEINGIDA